MHANQDQRDYWTIDAGDPWVAQAARMDALLAPLLETLLDKAGLAAGQNVLDVGCGTGASTRAIAQAVGPLGQVCGADISTALLTAARGLSDAENVTYLETDAQTHGFAPAAFDRLMSRFGVMFFADPVAAFANMARALKPSGQMHFATWGQIDQNPWFTLPARIARAEIGQLPKSDPDAPGPFSMRDIAKVESTLRAAGLADVAGVAQHMQFTLPGGPAQVAALCGHIGPLASAFTHFDCDAPTRKRVEGILAQAFADLPQGKVPAQINFFTAVRP